MLQLRSLDLPIFFICPPTQLLALREWSKWSPTTLMLCCISDLHPLTLLCPSPRGHTSKNSDSWTRGDKLWGNDNLTDSGGLFAPRCKNGTTRINLFDGTFCSCNLKRRRKVTPSCLLSHKLNCWNFVKLNSGIENQLLYWKWACIMMWTWSAIRSKIRKGVTAIKQKKNNEHDFVPIQTTFLWRITLQSSDNYYICVCIS